MRYSGDLTKNLYTKSYLFGQWRYLSHVLLVSFAPKKAGFDTMGAKLQSTVISLVYNKPFCLSRYIFDEMVKKIDAHARERFLLYPWFIMTILNHLLPDLPADPQVVQVSTIDRRVYSDCLHHNVRRPVAEHP